MQINKSAHNKVWLGDDESNVLSSTINSAWIC